MGGKSRFLVSKKMKGEELETKLPFASLTSWVRQGAAFPGMKFGSHPC